MKVEQGKGTTDHLMPLGYLLRANLDERSLIIIPDPSSSSSSPCSSTSCSGEGRRGEGEEQGEEEEEVDASLFIPNLFHQLLVTGIRHSVALVVGPS